MKNKTTIIVFSIILAIACLFQLSFTWKARSFESKAKAFAKKKAASGEDYGKAYRRYIDSLGGKTDYNLGIASYTYFECKQREVNLGLDLRGGMNVILEVDKGAIIRGLANDPEDGDLKKAIEESNKLVRDKGGDYVGYFIESLKKVNPSKKLALLFTKGNKSSITSASTDAEVAKMLTDETTNAIDRVYEVVEKRINQANVTQPTVQKIDGGRISVELPGVDNPRRMEDLVEKSANLEFYEVIGNNGPEQEATRILENLYKVSANPVMNKKPEPADTSKKDTTKTGSVAVNSTPDTAKKTPDTGAEAKTASTSEMNSSPLAKILKRYGGQYSSSAATVKASDRTRLQEILSGEAYKAALGNRTKIAFSAKPLDVDAKGKMVSNSDEYLVYFLKLDRDGKAAMSSDEENIIADARASSGQTGQIEVNMEMTPTAASLWAQLTGANAPTASRAGNFIAIVLDDRVYSAPSVNQKISGGNSQITGNFDVKEAEDLANVLKAGKLPAPARIVASEVVGPSLGQESINRGLNSLLFGFLAVLLFMILYYNRAGWISIVAVLANVFLIMGVLSSLGAALTLPGIAGIILTVGMAVDANVLIYERIKEELRNGKAAKAAISGGFRHALSAIIDGHVTTLLAALILMFTGAGPAFGFSIILAIGIFCSLFTALFITRLILDRRTEKGKDTSYDFKWNRNLLIGVNYDFVGRRRLSFIVSLPIIVAGVIMFFTKGGLSTGIDFKGGNSFIVQTDPGKNYNVDEIKHALDNNLKGSSNEVKTFGAGGKFRIVTTYFLNNDLKGTPVKDSMGDRKDVIGHKLVEALSGISLVTKNNDPTTAILSANKVGATVATSIRNKSILLLIIATIGMFLYIVFRFRNVAYATGAIIATIHDIVVVLCVFMILDKWVPFPIEFDQNLIAALLTIVGYSMNDTVIVFDRIRDLLKNRHAKADEPSLINNAINQTLSRTIVSSMTVFVVVIVLFFFGGDSLKGFSLAMIVGVLVGTYSSIFIATPVVVEFGSKRSKKELN
ncbi:MAG: protein translocase subunit SecDF [Bacteroidetes bacterium]|nr:protein translocase subunit SecDF [Bacteroidota bacterium]